MPAQGRMPLHRNTNKTEGFNLILSLIIDLCKLLRSLEIHVSFSSRPIPHFPEGLTDVGTMQIHHVLYLGKTTASTIDRISLSPTSDVACTPSDPQNSFSFCEHLNITWNSVLGCRLYKLPTGRSPCCLHTSRYFLPSLYNSFCNNFISVWINKHSPSQIPHQNALSAL
jgi:hypothetical protein